MRSFAEFAATYGHTDPTELAKLVAPGFLLLRPSAGSQGSGEHFETKIGRPGAAAGPMRSLTHSNVYDLQIQKNGAPVFMISVGRSERCDIRLTDDAVSKFHAYLRYHPQNGGFSLQDAESSNGTRVGGIALDAHTAVQLNEGADIDFGGAFHGIFHSAASMLKAIQLVRRFGGG